MTKPVIVTRAGKGSALTWTEGDSNLTNLRDATITVTDGTSSTAIDLNGTITFTAGSGISVDETSGTITIANTQSAGASAIDDLSDVTVTTPSNGQTLVYSSGSWINMTPSTGATTLTELADVSVTSPSNGQILSYSSSSSKWENVGTTFITALSEDPSPQLGANLKVAGYSIVSESNGNITIAPNGTGAVVLDGASWPTSLPTTGQVLTASDGSGNLTWASPASGATTLTELADINVTTPSNGQTLIYDNTSSKWINMSPATGISQLQDDPSPTLGANLRVNGYSITSISNGNINITPDGTGKIVLDGLSWPTSDGTNGQVLSTNGSGQLSWVTASGGGNSIIVLSCGNQGTVVFGSTANSEMTSNWTLHSSGGISGVSVSTNKFTLPAGTYQIIFPFSTSATASKSDWHLRNTTDSSTVTSFSYDSFTKGGASCAMYGAPSFNFTITGSKQFTLRTTSAVSGGWELISGHWSAGYTVKIIKTA